MLACDVLENLRKQNTSVKCSYFTDSFSSIMQLRQCQTFAMLGDRRINGESKRATDFQWAEPLIVIFDNVKG